MRVIFAGTPEFARVALAQLIRHGFEISLVLTQPDRPAGRGMKLQSSPVKQLALEHEIPVVQPRSLRLDGQYAEEAQIARQALSAGQAEVMVVAAYGLILPQWVLDATRYGGINIHASLLPRWRGAAPIHRAIESGDRLTGVTIMQMDAGLDTGDMLLSESLAIDSQDTTASLHDKLALLGGRMVVKALQRLATADLQPVPQATEGVTYAHKIGKNEANIDWNQSAELIERRVRAFNPFPVASTALANDVVKVWRAELVGHKVVDSGKPGTILTISEQGVVVQCGQGVLRLDELQRAGGKRLPANEFLRGFPMQVGAILQSNGPSA